MKSTHVMGTVAVLLAAGLGYLLYKDYKKKKCPCADKLKEAVIPPAPAAASAGASMGADGFKGKSR